MTLEFSREIFETKSSNIKFNKHPSGGNRVVPCGLTDMTKLILAFHNFVKASKKCELETFVTEWCFSNTLCVLHARPSSSSLSNFLTI